MKQNFDNTPDNFLQNIADDLSSISGSCNEIKETPLSCATTDDLNNMGTSISSAVTEKVDEMKTSIENQTKTVGEIGSDLTTTVNDLKTEITEKIDNLTANPPVQKVEKTIRVAKETWQVYLAMFFSVFSFILLGATFIWHESRIEQARISDIKYHYILMNGGINAEGWTVSKAGSATRSASSKSNRRRKHTKTVCRKPPAPSTKSNASKRKSTNSIPNNQ